MFTLDSPTNFLNHILNSFSFWYQWHTQYNTWTTQEYYNIIAYIFYVLRISKFIFTSRPLIAFASE